MESRVHEARHELREKSYEVLGRQVVGLQRLQQHMQDHLTSGARVLLHNFLKEISHHVSAKLKLVVDGLKQAGMSAETLGALDGN